MQKNLSNFLELLLILCKICINYDTVGLDNFIKFCSIYVSDREFIKLIHSCLKVLKLIPMGRKNLSYEDWLIDNLYNMYHSDSNTV